MIRRVVIRRFKRFEEVVFDLPGNVVLAGPNNTGKTTMLQAVAAWALALERWRQLNFRARRSRNGYARVPITRESFAAVPLRSFELMWNQRRSREPIEIEVTGADWRISMEFKADTTEQIKVRPMADTDPEKLRAFNLNVVFVPPMTGLSTDEPVYRKPKLDQLLGQGKPGDVIRNLLVEAHQSEVSWRRLQQSIEKLFGFTLLAPNADGAHIIAEYQSGVPAQRYDIASAGSGFQQVLMLLTFLLTHEGAVMLLDEPDAHLHVILQDAIYSELRKIAAEKKSQLVIATHSEVIINSVEPRELCVLLNQPRPLADTNERNTLIKSLRVLDNMDIMRAQNAKGVLYLEGSTDLALLREFARVLEHGVYPFLLTEVYWRPTVWEMRDGASGIKSQDHYQALCLVRADLPGLVLLDGDDKRQIPPTEITGRGLQRLRWRRYEIESYLLHPAAFERFVQQQLGDPATAALAVQDMRTYLETTFTPAFLTDPMRPNPLIEAYLEQRKAREEVIPPILAAAGLPDFPYTRYAEIAAVMQPEEIHPEVREKLDLIQRAFNV